MAAELLVVAERRWRGGNHPEPPGQLLHQFVREGGEVRPRSRVIPTPRAAAGGWPGPVAASREPASPASQPRGSPA